MSGRDLDGVQTLPPDRSQGMAALAMSAALRLVGYDKRSGRMAVQHEVPHRHAGAAKNIAGRRAADEPDLEVWELGASQAEFMGRLLHASIDTHRFDYFLEPHVGAPTD